MITFTVITPCKNAEKHILDTMMSIQRQSAFEKNLAKLECIIVDGESNDNTLKIINENKTKDLKLIVKKDNNMYEGLTRGLEIASGDIISYLNAGDIYNFNAFEVLNKIFKNNNNFWVTSNKILINENNEITNISLPFVYRKRFIRNGLYGKYFPFIQQESTFWKKELNSLINFNNCYFSAASALRHNYKYILANTTRSILFKHKIKNYSFNLRGLTDISEIF